MTRDDELVSRVRAALAHVAGVEEKTMFGSRGFMVRGRLCFGVRPERIMCRIDPAIHDEAVARDGCRTMEMNGRRYRGYVHVDAAVVRMDAALKRWIDLALEYNAASAPGTNAKRTATKRGRRVP